MKVTKELVALVKLCVLFILNKCKAMKNTNDADVTNNI